MKIGNAIAYEGHDLYEEQTFEMLEPMMINSLGIEIKVFSNFLVKNGEKGKIANIVEECGIEFYDVTFQNFITILGLHEYKGKLTF